MLTWAFIAHRLEPLFRRGALAWATGSFITPLAFWTGTAPEWIPTMMAAQSQHWSRWLIEAIAVISDLLTLGLVAVFKAVMQTDARAATAPVPDTAVTASR